MIPGPLIRAVLCGFGITAGIAAAIGIGLVPSASEALGRGVSDYRSSLLTMFVFIVSADNYEEVVRPGINLTFVFVVR